MADYVKLTKRGFVPFEWDGDAQDYLPTLKRSNNISHLRSTVKIEDGVTLGDVFNAVQGDPDLMDFMRRFSWCYPIEEFHQQALKPFVAALTDDPDELITLEVRCYSSFHKDYQDKTKTRYEGVRMDFVGLGKEGTHYSVSASPMNDIQHLPVHIVNTITFDKDWEPLFDGEVFNYDVTLLEFLDAIYFDISFYGGPFENENW